MCKQSKPGTHSSMTATGYEDRLLLSCILYTSSKCVQWLYSSLSPQTVYHRFAADGVSFSLNSDDPSVIECDLTGEYDLAATQLGLTTQQLVQSVRAGSPISLSFLKTTFSQWLFQCGL